MANVKGKEVSDGSHNVIYKAAEAGDVVNVVVEQVIVGENVKYKVAGVGDVPNAIASGVGGSVCYLSDPWDNAKTWDNTCIWKNGPPQYSPSLDFSDGRNSMYIPLLSGV